MINTIEIKAEEGDTLSGQESSFSYFIEHSKGELIVQNLSASELNWRNNTFLGRTSDSGTVRILNLGLSNSYAAIAGAFFQVNSKGSLHIESGIIE